MGVWDIEARRRFERIIVEQVIGRDKYLFEEAVPGKIVIDDLGKKHTIFPDDFADFEWQQIKPGAIIELTIVESVVDVRVNVADTKADVKIPTKSSPLWVIN